MAATMTSDYNPYGGCLNTLTVPKDDMKQFDWDGDSLRVQFRSLGEHRISGFVPQTDVEDKTKYCKTAELIAQLEAWQKWCEKSRDSYKTQSGIYVAKQVYEREVEISVLDGILTALRDGDDVWDA